MSREKQPFTLYLRKTKNGKGIWYYRTYDEFGRRTTGKSTGKTSKTQANIYCMQLFKENALIPNPSMKLKNYMRRKRFFEWGECQYCLENGTSKSHAIRCYSKN